MFTCISVRSRPRWVSAPCRRLYENVATWWLYEQTTRCEPGGMNIVVTSQAFPSHCDPTAQAAMALQRAGHGVQYVAPACMASYAFHSYGVRVTPGGVDWSRSGRIGLPLAEAFRARGNAGFMATLEERAA